MPIFAWLRSLLAPARASPPAADREAELGLALARITGGFRPPRLGSYELLAAYQSMPWLHAVIRRRAQAVARAQFALYRERRGGGGTSRRVRDVVDIIERHALLEELVLQGRVERVYDHPLLSLLRRPNRLLTRRAMLQVTSEHQDLLGESAWGLQRARPGGPPMAIYSIVPTWIAKAPTAEEPYWTLNLPSSAGLRRAEADVVWMRQHDPADPYNGRGISTARALGDELETDEAMATMAKARFYNRAAPEVAIGFEGQPMLSAEELRREADRLRDKHQGPNNAGQFHLFNRPFRAQTLAHTMVESQYVEGRRLLRDFCMQVFGCPPEIFGVLDNANRSTIDAAEVLFARYSTVPMLELIADEVDTWIRPQFPDGEGLYFTFVSPVPSDAEAQRGMKKALPSAFTVDEIRLAGGEAPLEGGRGAKLLSAPGAPIVPVDEPQADVIAPVEDKETPAAGAGAPDAVQDLALNGAQVTALVDILKSVSDDTLSKATAKPLIAAAFPAITAEAIDEMLAGVEAKSREEVDDVDQEDP